MVTGKLQIARQKKMKTLNDYRVMFYRMEIVEDKDEGGFPAFILSNGSSLALFVGGVMEDII